MIVLPLTSHCPSATSYTTSPYSAAVGEGQVKDEDVELFEVAENRLYTAVCLPVDRKLSVAPHDSIRTTSGSYREEWDEILRCRAPHPAPFISYLETNTSQRPEIVE